MSHGFLTRKPGKIIAISAVIAVTSLVAVVAVLNYQCGGCLGLWSADSRGPSESLNMNQYTIQYAPGQPNPTVLTLWIVNTGPSTAVIYSLTINDISGGSNPVSFQLSTSLATGATVVSGRLRFRVLFQERAHILSLNNYLAK